MHSEIPDVKAEIGRLETCVRTARGALLREQRHVRSSGRLDRAATAALVVLVGVSFIAAAAPSVPSVVRAPFQVQTTDGRVIFQVTQADPRGLVVSSPSEGGPSAVAAAPITASFLKAVSGEAGTQAVLGLGDNKTPVITLRYGGTGRLSLAAVGEEPDFNLTNDAGAQIVDLGWGAYHGGRLQLANAEGLAMVEAGMADNGVGVVRVYPNGDPGRGLFGLPGTFLCGIGCPR